MKRYKLKRNFEWVLLLTLLVVVGWLMLKICVAIRSLDLGGADHYWQSLKKPA